MDHVESVAAIQMEAGWVLKKMRQSRKIDACVAAIMCTEQVRSMVERYTGSYVYTSKKKEKNVQEASATAAA